MVLTSESLHLGKVALIESLEELVGLRCLVLVGTLLDDIGLDHLPVTYLPDDFFDAKTVDRYLLVFFVPGGLGFQIIRLLQHRHHLEDEVAVVVLLQVEIEIPLADIELDKLPETARRSHTL